MKRRRALIGCHFCAQNYAHIDYKDVDVLKDYVTDYGRITPRYVNGNCATHQRMLARAVKLARFMALLPYVGEVHTDEN